MEQVRASLAQETIMARIVQVTREDQQRAGVVLRACKVSAQLKTIATSVPQLQQALDTLKGDINQSTTAQIALVTTEITTTAEKVIDKVRVGFQGALEATRNSDTQNVPPAPSRQTSRTIVLFLCSFSLTANPSGLRLQNRACLSSSSFPMLGLR